MLPKKGSDDSVDLKELIDDLRRRGIKTPVLLRFNDIIAAQVQSLAMSFNKSIDEYNYQSTYRTVMPSRLTNNATWLSSWLNKARRIG